MTLESRLIGAAAMLAVILVLGACGGATVEVTGRAKAATSESTATTVADGARDSAPSTTPPTTAAPTSPAPTTAPATSAAPAERSDEAYCAAAGRLMNSGLQSALDLDVLGTDSEATKTKFKEAMHSFDGFVSDMERSAPSAVAADMKTVSSATSAAVDALDSASGVRGLFDAMKNVQTREATEASERVASYTLEHCGFSLEGSATTTTD